MPPTRVVCLGEAMVELSLSAEAPQQAAIGFAGDTLNTAIYLKRCAPALNVGYATKVGVDPFSDRMLGLMQAEALDTGLVARSQTALPGVYAISTDSTGERSFMYWRSASAAREMFTAPGLTFEGLGACDVLYFSAISLAILPPDHRAALIEWLPDFRAAGGRVAFDSNYRPALWADAETAQQIVTRMWRLTDIALPSVDDEMALFGDADEAAVLRRFAGYGVKSGGLKRGERGPCAFGGASGAGFAPAARVIDSTAAGDSFNAGFLAAHLTGQTADACLEAGHALAARVVGYRGAIIPRDAM